MTFEFDDEAGFGGEEKDPIEVAIDRLGERVEAAVHRLGDQLTETLAEIHGRSTHDVPEAETEVEGKICPCCLIQFRKFAPWASFLSAEQRVELAKELLEGTSERVTHR
jgi:hypothetical protein